MATTIELEELMRQELHVLRDILSNLKEEQEAILAKELHRLDMVIEERLNILEAYEVLDVLIREDAKKRAAASQQPEPVTHEEALHVIQNIVGCEEIGLLALCSQLLALFQEIHHQNAITMQYIQNGDSQLRRKISPEKIPREIKNKIRLGLLELNQNEE